MAQVGFAAALFATALPAHGAPQAPARASVPRGVQTARASLPRGARVLERAPGRFGPIFVVEEAGQRALRFGDPTAEDQSAYRPKAPHREPVAYLSLALRALAWVEAPRRVLVIGLGGGSYLRHLRRLAPRAMLEAVEIDPVVPRLARRWMGLDAAGAVKVRLDDGRRALARDPTRYDLILVDAYDAEDYAPHLGTLEFFSLAASRLTPVGVLVANLSPNDRGQQARLLATFARALPGALCRVAAPDTNTVGFGGPVVRARPRALGSRRFRRLVARHRAGLFWSDGGPCALPLDRARILRDPPPTPPPPRAGASGVRESQRLEPPRDPAQRRSAPAR